MTDRLLVVLAMCVLVVAIVLVARLRPRLQSRRLPATGLPAGLYLLTSDGCATCDQARATLSARPADFTELRWQSEPEVFERLSVDAVPSVLLVGSDGIARWWRGGVPIFGGRSRAGNRGTRP